MKKLIYKFALLAMLLILMNWIYGYFFLEKDLLKHSDQIQLSWNMAKDSCEIVYTGESSNHSFSWYDKDRRKISDFVFDYFPDVKTGDMTKDASHAEVYYYLLKNIPQTTPVKTVIVTMNMRSFGYDWIESNLETPIQKQLVMMKDNPPLFNRFKLAFKAYDIKTEKERTEARDYHRQNNKLVFPYPFEYDNTADWNRAIAHRGVSHEGKWNQPLTDLACHFIKGYSFIIDDDNPRVKDFDRIVELAKERGWNVIFNLMAENVDRANELVGKELIYLIKHNRDYLIERYDNIDNVTVVDNVGNVRNGLFIDQNWTTEHYKEMGRRSIAKNVAQAAREYHHESYVENDCFVTQRNQYKIKHDEKPLSISSSAPYGMIIADNTSAIDSICEKVYISANVFSDKLSDESAIVMELHKDGTIMRNEIFVLNKMTDAVGKWDFCTTVLPIDSSFFNADGFRIFIHNPSESPVLVSSLDVSFEYDGYADGN